MLSSLLFLYNLFFIVQEATAGGDSSRRLEISN